MSTTIGRPLSLLVELYVMLPHNLSEYITISSDIYSSKIDSLTLKEYIMARKYICDTRHINCYTCNPMIQAAEKVMTECLKFSKHFFLILLGRFLQMPLVAVRVVNKLHLMAKVNGLDYSSIYPAD